MSHQDRPSILEIVSSYVDLRRAGKEYIGSCLFHAEKTPSFSVNEEKSLFYCHGCHEGGDTIRFIEKIEGLTFTQALAHLGLTDQPKPTRAEIKERERVRQASRNLAAWAIALSERIGARMRELGQRAYTTRKVLRELPRADEEPLLDEIENCERQWDIFQALDDDLNGPPRSSWNYGNSATRWRGLLMNTDKLTRELAKEIKGLPEGEQAEVIESTQADTDPIKAITASLDGLADDAPLGRVEDTLRSLALSLVGTNPLRRATVREAVVKKLERFGISSPARMVDAAFQDGQAGTPDQQQGRPVVFDDPEPWPDAVDGAALLDDITVTLKHFIVLPHHTPEAIALWICHACALEAFTISPILAICSPTKGSGKTLLLDVISYLLVKKLFVSNTTPATLFRCV